MPPKTTSQSCSHGMSGPQTLFIAKLLLASHMNLHEKSMKDHGQLMGDRLAWTGFTEHEPGFMMNFGLWSSPYSSLIRTLWFAYISSLHLAFCQLLVPWILIVRRGTLYPWSFSYSLCLPLICLFWLPGNLFLALTGLALNPSQQSSQGFCNIPSIRTTGLPLSCIFVSQLATWAWCWMAQETRT